MDDVRLIDANALPNFKCKVTATIGDQKCPAEMRFVFWQDIEKAPTIDAVPVVHARWVDPCINKYGHPCHHCSACRFKASQKDRNFCPNCGAKMDGGAADDR